MPRDLPQSFKQLLRDKSNAEAWVVLLEIEVPTDPPTRFRFTDQKSQINFGKSSAGVDIPYYPATFEVKEWAEESDGSVPELEVVVDHAVFDMRQALEDHDGLKDQPAVIRVVNSSLLADETAQVAVHGVVGPPEVSQASVTFTVGGRDITERAFPPRREQAHHCRHPRFGAGACPYPINDPAAVYTTCPRTLSACSDRGDDMVSMGYPDRLPLQFGAAPGMKRGARS